MANKEDHSVSTVPVGPPDFSREYKTVFSWQPSKSLLASIRAYQQAAQSSGLRAIFLRKMNVIRHRFWSVVTGADIPLNCKLGAGLLIPHPNGIVVHPDAIIGPNCLLFQQVTLGYQNGGVPTIGGHVDIGAGAKILGAIRVGDYVQIGANAVVLADVPSGATAVGVPARVIIKRADGHDVLPEEQ